MAQIGVLRQGYLAALRFFNGRYGEICAPQREAFRCPPCRLRAAGGYNEKASVVSA